MPMEGSEIVWSTWRSGRECVGFVLVRDGLGQLRAYVGVGKGENRDEDKRHIAHYGCRLSFDEAKPFFPTIKREEWANQ